VDHGPAERDNSRDQQDEDHHVVVAYTVRHDSGDHATKKGGCVHDGDHVKGGLCRRAMARRIRRDIKEGVEQAQEAEAEANADGDKDATPEQREGRILRLRGWRGRTALYRGLQDRLGLFGWLSNRNACECQERQHCKPQDTDRPRKSEISLGQEFLNHDRPDYSPNRRTSGDHPQGEATMVWQIAGNHRERGPCDKTHTDPKKHRLSQKDLVVLGAERKHKNRYEDPDRPGDEQNL